MNKGVVESPTTTAWPAGRRADLQAVSANAQSPSCRALFKMDQFASTSCSPWWVWDDHEALPVMPCSNSSSWRSSSLMVAERAIFLSNKVLRQKVFGRCFRPSAFTWHEWHCFDAAYFYHISWRFLFLSPLPLYSVMLWPWKEKVPNQKDLGTSSRSYFFKRSFWETANQASARLASLPEGQQTQFVPRLQKKQVITEMKHGYLYINKLIYKYIYIKHQTWL